MIKMTAKTGSAAAILTLALIAITPLCGLLFACGCAWPWSGFFFGCNYFDPTAEHHCPWCASTLAGWLSVGVSITLGTLASLAPFTAQARRSGSETLIRTGAGILAFLCTAVLSGWLAARSQHYPHGPIGDRETAATQDNAANADRSQSIPPSR
ncbi:hypothetical protein [Methylomicrobium lacus]|uniref:hypothetical protein n=1 Tax=Methylomicrobium lacus TaxID=136992 RepID=UPI0035A9248C